METVSGIPVVDFSAFSIEHKTRPNTDSDEVQELARNIFHAFSTVGFVYLKNHGVPQSQIDKVLEVMDDFFGQETIVKSKYQKAKGVSPNGWDELERESTNIDRPPDLKESFDVGHVHDANFKWPEEDLPSFKPTLQLFYSQLDALAMRVLSAMAVGLRLDHDIFEDFYKHRGTSGGGTQLRLNYYPKITGNITLKPGQIRCGEHTDYGGITLLIQDDAGGLEVATVENMYVPATPIKGTILVNIADLMQRWTSDILKSTSHRVLVPESEVNRSAPRRSLVFFCDPDKEAVITCVDGSNKYPSIKAGKYIEDILAATYKF